MASQLQEQAVRPAYDAPEAYAPFSAAEWLSYFEGNKANRPTITFPQGISISPALRIPLIRSLQRFQIGETGEGKHLRKFAARLKDPAYEQCIDLFIKEEQSHARALAEIIGAMEGTLLTWHWTDLAFIALRRMFGLKTEIFILLIAEIVGKCFYWRCADNILDKRVSTAFSLIVVDEIAHIQFHCAFLSSQLSTLPSFARRAIFAVWAVVFYAACSVFIVDHKRTLTELGVTSKDFMTECATTFQRAASRSLGFSAP